jgi:hypothetical protein
VRGELGLGLESSHAACVRVRVEIMGSPKCRIVGKSQTLTSSHERSHVLHPHPCHMFMAHGC